MSTSQIGPYSRPPSLAKISGRTREGRLIRDTRKMLIDHLGGKISATQSMMIEGAVQLALRLALMDRAFAETGKQTDHDRNQYLAWRGALNRTLRDLGMKGAAQRQPTLTEYKASRTAAAA